jgi:hypothetical protein
MSSISPCATTFVVIWRRLAAADCLEASCAAVISCSLFWWEIA